MFEDNQIPIIQYRKNETNFPQDWPLEFSEQCNGKSLLYEMVGRKRRRDFSQRFSNVPRFENS